jgi:hypothetical protein
VLGVAHAEDVAGELHHDVLKAGAGAQKRDGAGPGQRDRLKGAVGAAVGAARRHPDAVVVGEAIGPAVEGVGTHPRGLGLRAQPVGGVAYGRGGGGVGLVVLPVVAHDGDADGGGRRHGPGLYAGHRASTALPRGDSR